MKAGTGKVTKIGSERYVASINQGWWIAEGKTSKQAKERVLKRYWQEREKHNI